MICKRCGQQVLKELIAEKRRLKGENVRAGLFKRKAAGLAIGRPKKRDDAKIWKLRKRGLSIRAIAKIIGVSVAPVQQSLAARAEGERADE